MSEQTNLQARYGTISDLCGGDLDSLLAKTSLIGKSSSSSSSNKYDQLYVPLPAIVNLANILHQPQQSKEETVSEQQQVTKALEAVDTKLEERRKELGLQLELLGFSDWRKDLVELQKRDKTKNVEDLISDVYKAWNLEKASDIQEIHSKKLGGALSNLKSSLKEWDEMGWTASIFSRLGLTGHRAALVAEIEADKNNVNSRFKTIQEFSKELKSTRIELTEAFSANKDRKDAVEQAQAALVSGNLQQAQIFSEKADDLVSVIKTRLLKADERLSHRHAVDYDAQMAELRKAREKWTQVDKSYGTTIAWMDGISRGALMAVAVGAGMLAVPVGAGFLLAFALSLGVTTLVGSGLAALRTFGSKLFWGGQSQTTWAEAYQDWKTTTFESSLMGLGGGMMAGLKAIFAAGAGATRIAASMGTFSRVVNSARAAAGSGGTAIGTSMPSTVYHYREEYIQHSEIINQMVYGDKELSQEELKWMEGKGMIPWAEERGIVWRDPKTGQLVNELSEQDKKDLYLHLCTQKGMHLAQVYGGDLALTGLCGFGGHYMATCRNFHLKGLTPPMTAPTVSAGATTRAIFNKPGIVGLQLSSHAMECAMSGFTAERTLKARETYLGETITDEMRARAYGQAFSGQIIGNIQGDKMARMQRMAEAFRTDAQEQANTVAAANIQKTGVKVDQVDRIHLVHDIDAKVQGSHREIFVGNTVRDLDPASRAVDMWVADGNAKVLDQATGKPRANTGKPAAAEVTQALKHVGDQTNHTKTYKEAFDGNLKGNNAVIADRQSRITVEGDLTHAKVAKAQFEELTTHLKCVEGEADWRAGRYESGNGRDTNGVLNAVQKKYKAIAESVSAPLSYLRKRFDPVIGVATYPFRKIYDVGKFILDAPVIGDGLKFCGHFAKRHFVDFPLFKTIHLYSGINSASLLHGPAGIVAYLTVGFNITNHLGFKIGRTLGFNRSRPLDASDALSSRMEIDHTLSRMKSLSELHPELKIPKELEARLNKTAKRIDIMFSECSRPKSTNGFMAMGMTSMALSGFWQPAAVYFGYKALTSTPVKSLCKGTFDFVTPHGLREWGADVCTATAKGLMAKGPFGIGRMIRGETVVHDWIPLVGPLWRKTIGAGIELASHQMLKLSDAVLPSNLKMQKQDKYTAGMLADLQATCRRGWTDTMGVDHMKMIKAIEDQLVSDLASRNTNVKDFARTLDVLFREVDTPIRDQILYRLGIVAKIDPTVSTNPVPDRVLRALRERAARRAGTGGTGPREFRSGGRRPLRGDVEPDKLELLTKLIDQPDRSTELLAPHKDPKKQASSSYEVMKGRAKKEFSSAMYKATSGDDFDLARITELLRSRESYDSYGEIRKEIIGQDEVPASGGRRGRSARDGLLLKVLEKELELRRSSDPDPAVNTANRAKAVELHKVAELLESYVLRRERLLAILLGQTPPDSLDIHVTTTGIVSTTPIRVRLKLLREARRSASVRDEQGQREQVLKLNENDPEMSRFEQRERRKAVQAELDDLTISHSEKKELISWLRGELESGRKEITDKRVKEYLKNPTEYAQRVSMTPFENAKVRDLVKKAKHGLKIDETKINKRAEALIKNPGSTIDAQAVRYESELRAAAVRAQRLGIHSEAEVNQLIVSLERDPNLVNPAINNSMRNYARTMADTTQSNLARQQARNNLKGLLSSDLEQVKQLFKKAQKEAEHGLKIDEAKINSSAEALIRDPRSTIGAPAVRYESKLRAAAVKAQRLGIHSEAEVDQLIVSLERDPTLAHPAMNNKRRNYAMTMADTTQPNLAREQAKNNLKDLLSRDLNQVKQLFKKAHTPTEVKYRDDKIDVDARVKDFIDDPSRPIPGRKVAGWIDCCKPSQWMRSLFKMTLGDLHLTWAAKNCQSLGVRSQADIDKLVENLARDPELRNDGMGWRTRKLARTMASNDESTETRYQAERELRKLLSEDLNHVKGAVKQIEANREAAHKAIVKMVDTAFDTVSPLAVNLRRQMEILGLVRNDIASALQYNPRSSWRTFFLRTVLPPDVFDPAVMERRHNLWDTIIDSEDYRGYRARDRRPERMPEQYPSLDMTLRPADPRAYGDSWWQQKIFSWASGPVNQRYSGLYGDSQVLRGADWALRRLGMR